jgi:eukaryotic-like serine/threonine-protein kinase
LTSDTAHRLATALADRYRIERELGQGGMATVYLAQDLKHDRRVAVKVLRPELAAVIGADRFLSEIKTTANLQHPHILPLHDSGEADGFLFYVMPYVEGVSLRDRITREHQLPVDEAVRLAREVAGALDYAHRHGVIHRDIKPENILLHDGSALVADFGIALAVSTAGTRMTETGMSLGTPHYMSPEQAMGEREITARSDVYALGCVTYEMLVGEPPFTGPTAQAIIARVMTEDPRALTGQRKTIPPGVEAAVLTALQKLPADRFATAADFAAALADRQFTAAGKHSTTRATASQGTAVWRRGTYTLLALSAALLVVALLGWLRPAPKADTSRQRVTLWQHSLGRNLAPGSEREATQAAIAPDGSSIVFADSIGGTLHLMRKLRNESTPTPLAGTERAVSPVFSPDGNWIGYITTDGKLRKVPVEGGGSITLADNVNLVYTEAAWLDDGTIIYVGSRQELRRVSSSGGASRPVETDTSRQHFSILTISPLPGSRGILYTTCPGNCAIESAVRVFDFAADSSRILVPNAAGAWYSLTGHLLYTDRAGGLYATGFDAKRLALTSAPVPVIDDVVATSFTMSASGSVLYTVAAGSSKPAELMWVSRDGGAVPLDSSWRADFGYPALSPDGNSLAVSVAEGTTQLWIRRSDGTRQKLTQDGTVNWRPAWTPDGRSVAFVSNRRGGGGQNDFDLYQMRVDGSAPAELLLHHTFGVWEGEFSRDMQWLVFRSDEAGGDGNIRARHLGGDTALVPLVVDKSLTQQVALSPDGRWLAYSGDATGRREIYVTPFPGATSTRLVSRDGGIEPRWAHNGRELFYKGGSQLMSVDVTPGPMLTLGAPRPLFSVTGYRSARNRPQYDVAPDDQHFVMIKELDTDARGEVVYVENWFKELKAKVKR